MERAYQWGIRVEILLSLVQNLDVLTWSPYEVLGVDPTFIMHQLNVDPLTPPNKQRPRRAAKEEKVEKLKGVGAIKEVFFSKWLAQHDGCNEKER